MAAASALGGEHGGTMWEAAKRNDVHRLHALISAFPGDLDTPNVHTGYTPAIHAAAADSVDALTTLARHGADLNKPGPMGITCVFAAATSGAIRALKVLLDASAAVDVEHDDETALEWLGLPCETGSALGSRHHGNRLVAAQKLILAGAYVESGVIVHGPSRDILRAWASTELAAEAGFHTFIMGLARGISKAGVASALTMLSVDGIPQRVASYLPRHGVREYRHLQRAVWVWHREAP